MLNKLVKSLFSPSLGRRFERSAGWFFLLSGGLLVLTVAIGWKSDGRFGWPIFWALLMILTMSLITLHTRTLEEGPAARGGGTDPDADVNVLFRVAFAYVAIVLSVAGTLLIYPQLFSAPGDDTGASTAYTKRALAIVRGCDYSPPGSRVLAPVPAAQPAATATNDAGSRGNAAGEQSEKTVPDIVADRRAPEPQDRRAVMPEGANCGDIPPQWVLSIGGNILRCHINGDCYGKIDDAKSNSTKNEGSVGGVFKKADAMPRDSVCSPLRPDFCAHPEAELETAKLKHLKLVRNLEASRTRLWELDLLSRANAAFDHTERISVLNSIADLPAKIKTADADIAVWERAAGKSKKLAQKEKEDRALLQNILGEPIVGGIVVPVYFLAIAIVGACVGMARKLPEYHHRATTYYRQTYDPEKHGTEVPIAKSKARDFLVFQHIQVAFAPAIALLAYSFVRPDDVAAAALLGFAAGYSSEIFLLAIREFSDRLIGLGLRPIRVATGAGPDVAVAGHVGRRVMLTQPLGTFGVGSVGVVTGVHDGKVIVTADRDEHNADRKRPETFKPKSLNFFRLLD